MKTVLYLGLDPTHCKAEGHIIHCPLIEIVPRPVDESAFEALAEYTHVLVTSKSAIQILTDYLPDTTLLKDKKFLAVGQVTAKHIQKHGLTVSAIAQDETSEGVIKEILAVLPKSAYLFWPHSSLSRPVIRDYLNREGYKYRECLLYDTLPKKPNKPIDLDAIDEIIFTSPSTVDAFIQFFGPLPQNKTLRAIGPITESRLSK